MRHSPFISLRAGGMVLLAIAFSMATICATDAVAAPSVVPRTVSYQGLLTDAQGIIVADGNYTINFRIYNDPNAGVRIWDETQTVTTHNGVFDVELGSVNPLTVWTFYSEVWLTMLIEGMAVNTPRTPILATPYSFRAASLEDGALTSAMIAPGTVVKSINGVKDHAYLVPGSNVSISQTGQEITISAAGGAGGDDGDWTISGAHVYRDGTGSVAIGTSTVQPWSANQTMLQVGASLFPSIALDRTGSSFQRWMLMQDSFSNSLWIGPAASPTSPPSAVLLLRDTGAVGVGITPIATLSVLGGNGDLVATNGDFAIGNGSTYFKMGLSNTGVNAGRFSMRSVSPTAPAIALGTGTKDVLVVEGSELHYFGEANNYLMRLRGDPNATEGAVLDLYGHVPTVRSRISMDAQNGSNATVFLRQDNGMNGLRLNAGAGGSGAEILLYDGNGAESIRIDSEYTGGSGRIRTPTLEITGGSDLSEQFRVNSRRPLQDISEDAGMEKPEPGMVVAIDPDNPGELMLSHTRYDRRVAGVISGAGGVKTGMLMGQTGSIADGDHPVALTGRVYVWVDASEYPVEPGDLLTTASVAGHAMKVTDHDQAVGAILGKAMTGLESGRGLVLTLVSLQ